MPYAPVRNCRAPVLVGGADDVGAVLVYRVVKAQFWEEFLFGETAKQPGCSGLSLRPLLSLCPREASHTLRSWFALWPAFPLRAGIA